MKPHPIPENQVCSECGMDWSKHPDEPRRRDCIELLKAEVASHGWRFYPYQVTYTCNCCWQNPCQCGTGWVQTTTDTVTISALN